MEIPFRRRASEPLPLPFFFFCATCKSPPRRFYSTARALLELFSVHSSRCLVFFCCFSGALLGKKTKNNWETLDKRRKGERERERSRLDLFLLLPLFLLVRRAAGRSTRMNEKRKKRKKKSLKRSNVFYQATFFFVKVLTFSSSFSARVG